MKKKTSSRPIRNRRDYLHRCWTTIRISLEKFIKIKSFDPKQQQQQKKGRENLQTFLKRKVILVSIS